MGGGGVSGRGGGGLGSGWGGKGGVLLLADALAHAIQRNKAYYYCSRDSQFIQINSNEGGGTRIIGQNQYAPFYSFTTQDSLPSSGQDISSLLLDGEGSSWREVHWSLNCWTHLLRRQKVMRRCFLRQARQWSITHRPKLLQSGTCQGRPYSSRTSVSLAWRSALTSSSLSSSSPRWPAKLLRLAMILAMQCLYSSFELSRGLSWLAGSWWAGVRRWAVRASRQIRALGCWKSGCGGSRVLATWVAAWLTFFLKARASSRGRASRRGRSSRWKSFFLILEFMRSLLLTVAVRAGKLIVCANHPWLSTQWISASDTTFLPSKLARVPTQSSQWRCSPESARCSMRGMNRFLGQFFSKEAGWGAEGQGSSGRQGRRSLVSPPRSLSSSSSSRVGSMANQDQIMIKQQSLLLRDTCQHYRYPLLNLPKCQFNFIILIPIILAYISINISSLPLAFYLFMRPENSQNRSAYNNSNSSNRFVRNLMSYIPPPEEETKPEKEEKTASLIMLPRSVGALDKNVIFQDVDRTTTANSTSQSREATSKSTNNPVGLLSNVFMGSTTKYVKSSIEPTPTPTKPKQVEEDSSKTTPAAGRFARNRQGKDTSESKPVETKSKLLAVESVIKYEPSLTDRSQEGGRKIERKQERTRELKFVEKQKNESVIEAEDTSLVTARPTARTTATKTVVEVAKIQEVVQQPKTYQPIQRNVRKLPAETSPVQQSKSEIKEEVIEVKPTVQTRPLLNRSSNYTPPPTLTPSEPTPIDSRVRINSNRQNSIILKTQPAPQQSKTSPSQLRLQSKIVSSIEVEDKVMLKKTAVAILTVKRLLKNRMSDSWRSLRINQVTNKVKAVNEGNLVAISAAQILRNKENNLVKLGFQTIKRKFATPYIQSLKPYIDSAPSNYKQTAAVLLDRLYQSKLRKILQIIRTKKDHINQRAKSLQGLLTFYKRKQTNRYSIAFDALKTKPRQKEYLLNQLSNIVLKINKYKLATPFNKLLLTNIKSNTIETSANEKKIAPKLQTKSEIFQMPNNDSPALIDKLDKLKKSITSTNAQLSSLESKYKQRKNYIQSEKQEITEKKAQLQQLNQDMTNEITHKKQQSTQIKHDMEHLKHPQEVQLEEPNEPTKLPLLTNIYIAHTKNPTDLLLTSELIAQHSLQQNDSSTLLTEWQLILQNVELKRMIASYENVDPKQYRARTALAEEQSLLKRIISSYAREQYFWEWIHLSAN